MKKVYFFILTVITTLFVLGLALLALNDVLNGSLFTIKDSYLIYINYAKEYGAITLLCLFAFGGLAGRIVKFILIFCIIIAIIVIVIANAAPEWLTKIFNTASLMI